MMIRQIDQELDYDGPPDSRRIVTGNQECSWSASSPRRTMSVILWDGEDYFVDVYRERLLAIFRPITVDGMPAVEERSSANSVFCNTTVGLGLARALDIQVSIDEVVDGPALDPCQEGRRIAETIVATLPPA